MDVPTSEIFVDMYVSCIIIPTGFTSCIDEHTISVTFLKPVFFDVEKLNQFSRIVSL